MEPLVFRPRAALTMAIALSLVLVVASLIGWFALPSDIRALFTGLQLGTLVFFVAFMIGLMMVIGLSQVRVDGDGLTIRNGLRTHVVAWDEVRGFRFTEHDPWAYVLMDGQPDQRPLMGIQRTDHERAEAMVATLRDRQAQR